MSHEIGLSCGELNPQELMDQLESQGDWNECGVALDLRDPKGRFRGPIDPTILVAVVSALGGGVTALLAGMLQVAKQRMAERIVLQAPNGARLEIPASTPADEVDRLVKKVKEMGLKKVSIE